ncbi:hypothetical protein ABIF64_000446 [Bradyrhizobium japonicum]
MFGCYTQPTCDMQPATDQSKARRTSRQSRPPRAIDPLRGRVDGNTTIGRRVRHRWRLYLAELTSPDAALQRAFAADCAELAVAIEDMQGRQLAGENVAEDLVRLRNELRRAEGKLHLKSSKAEPETDPSASALEWLDSFKPAAEAST